MPVFNLELFLVGCAGGLLPDILRVVRNRYEIKSHGYLRSPMFWIGIVFLVVLGGFAAWILDSNGVKEALAFGFAAPELVSQIIGGVTRSTGSQLLPTPKAQPLIVRWWEK